MIIFKVHRFRLVCCSLRLPFIWLCFLLPLLLLLLNIELLQLDQLLSLLLSQYRGSGFIVFYVTLLAYHLLASDHCQFLFVNALGGARFVHVVALVLRPHD